MLVKMANDKLFDANWRESALNAEGTWASSVFENSTDIGAIYLDTISRWFAEFPGSNKQKNHLKASLRSVNNSDHLGAVNELSWWKFWTSRGFDLKPIPTGKSPTPDYILKPDAIGSIFEITTLNPSKDERCNEINYSQENSMRRITAKAIEEKIGQLRYGYQKNMASIFVLFNYDEWSGFGTQFYKLISNADFVASMPDELFAIIYVERFIIRGIPHFKKNSIVMVDNPSAGIQYSGKIKSMIKEMEDDENWVICENA